MKNIKDLAASTAQNWGTIAGEIDNNFRGTSDDIRNDVTYVRGLDASNNPIKISKADLATVVGSLFKEDGFLRFKDYGQLLGADFTTKNATVGFGYSESNDGSGFAGIFISVSNGLAKWQLKSNLNNAELKYRQTNFNGVDTTGWVSIALN